jgi:hypothetical protein
VPRRRYPVPVELGLVLKLAQFARREVMFDGFLQTDYIYPIVPKSILELCAMSRRIPAADILNQEPHKALVRLLAPFLTVRGDFFLRLLGASMRVLDALPTVSPPSATTISE